ncbi:MAG: potassium-transporting ATPase subunit KdpC [Candidatus Omnitrophica bacterium]|nr:potassium-transporting ATPase subunit KdpC [Candidatus Omnitrophota bacterium]
MLTIVLRPLFVLFLFSVLTGVVYPLFITGLGQSFFPRQANGSLLWQGGKPVGSELIAQPFSKARYFQGRPSAVDQITANSGASNYGPTSAKLMDSLKERIAAVVRSNPLADKENLPADLVLTSGSGLDPHLSPKAALLQADRIARARRITKESVIALITKNVEQKQAGFLGAERVNVLKLNLALDAMKGAVDE